MTDETEKRGRPTAYTHELAEAICQRLAGGESLRSICRGEEMPALSTVLLWVVENRENFSEQYERARGAQGMAYGDYVAEVAEDVREGGIDPQSAKVMIDAYKWSAERMAPKKYGQKQEIDHRSGDGSMSPPKTLEDFYGGSDGGKTDS